MNEKVLVRCSTHVTHDYLLLATRENIKNGNNMKALKSLR